MDRVRAAAGTSFTVTGALFPARSMNDRTSLSFFAEATTSTTTRLAPGSTCQLLTPAGAPPLSSRFLTASSSRALCSTSLTAAPVARTASALPPPVRATVSFPLFASYQSPP